MLDVDVELKPKESKIVKHSKKHADYDQRKLHKPQIPPNHRQDEDCAERKVQIRLGQAQEIQGSGNKKQIQRCQQSLDASCQKPPFGNHHQNDVTDGEAKSEAKLKGKAFRPKRAKQSKIGSDNHEKPAKR